MLSQPHPQPRRALVAVALAACILLPPTASRSLDPPIPRTPYLVPTAPWEFVTASNSAPISLHLALAPAAGAALPTHFNITSYSHRTVAASLPTKQTSASTLTATIPAGTLRQGFFELLFPPPCPSPACAAAATLGLLVLSPTPAAPAAFFAMDAALSWLDTAPSHRLALLRALQHCGIAFARERLDLGDVFPTAAALASPVFNPAPRAYDDLRQLYASLGLRVLEMVQGAPGWASHLANSPYPSNLTAVVAMYQQLAARWGGVWQAVEVWNEPDNMFGGWLPADQLLPVVKAVSFALRDTPHRVVSGVFTEDVFRFGPSFVDLAIRNGLLHNIDVLSFHSYVDPMYQESLVAAFRGLLAANGRPDLPLVCSECGNPPAFRWPANQTRPTDTAQDVAAAARLVMKQVENLVTGVAASCPFVLPDYEEGGLDFGLFGLAVTPLRAFAAYAQAARVLSQAEYVGDLSYGFPGFFARQRLFALPPSRRSALHNATHVAVLYTDQPGLWVNQCGGLQLAVVEGADGRLLAAAPAFPESQPWFGLEVTDGLVYAFYTAPPPYVPYTTAASLRVQAGGSRRSIGSSASPPAQPRQPQPVVLQYLYNASQTTAGGVGGNVRPGAFVDHTGYFVTAANASSLFFTVLAHNLDPTRTLAVDLAVQGAWPDAPSAQHVAFTLTPAAVHTVVTRLDLGPGLAAGQGTASVNASATWSDVDVDVGAPQASAPSASSADPSASAREYIAIDFRLAGQ